MILNEKGIYWIASYPKSGNTWFRIFLANLLSDSEEPVSINEINNTPIASDRLLFEQFAGVESSDLLQEEIERLRPQIYEHWTANSNKTLFIKIHDAYAYTSENKPLVSTKATLGALYIIRNPLDIVPSLSHHSHCSIDGAIERMGDKNFGLCANPEKLSRQLCQRLLSWSGHVLSWVEAREVSSHTLRYEDMLLKPLESFEKAVRFLKLNKSKNEIRNAIDLSSFEKLKAQENEHGFRVKPLEAESFFWKGKSGTWKDCLSKKQVEKVIRDHGEVMKRFGYL